MEGKCSPEEAESILNALAENPHLLDEYINKDQWDEIELNTVVMPEDVQQRIRANVLEHTNTKKKETYLLRYRRVAAAACLAMIVTGWLYFHQNNSPLPVAETARTEAKAQTNNFPVDTTVRNNGKNKVRIVLADGSSVLLSANSEIRYQPQFKGPKRDIYLTGEAYFEVAKNKLRPFTVYSKSISATALGTSFTVRAFKNDRVANVNLYTGKVVVKPVKDQAGVAKCIYLIPGDRLTINTETFHSEISTVNLPVPAEKKRNQNTAAGRKDPFVFDRTPLADVFDKLVNSITYILNTTKNY